MAEVSQQETAAGLLRRIRREQGQSLRAASAELGLAVSHLSRIERGERKAAPDTSRRIAAYYGVSPEVLALLDGIVPIDVVHILQEHPEELEVLRSKYGRNAAGSSG